MERRKVEVGRDHVQKLIGTSPMRAVHELIWNGLDAGGNRVDVQVRCNALGAADRIEVIDHGPGIAREELEVAFGKIGDSSKARQPTNTEGRAFHGREGKGRFRSLAICPKVLWKTTYRTPGGDLQTYSVTLSRDDPEFFEATDPEPTTGQPTGTHVILDGVDRGHVTLSATTANELAEEYAAYLKSYPNVELYWNSQKVTLAPLIRREATIKVPVPDKSGATLDLDIIEWNFKPSAKRLHICDESGFSFHETAAGVHAPGIDYTAYLKTPKARAWGEDNRFALEDLDEEIAALVEAARSSLRVHLRRWLAEDSRSVVDQWKAERIYPFEGEPEGTVATTERDVFDIVAVQVNDQHPTFAASNKETKKLTLALIRQALEANPTALSRVLRELLALSDNEQVAFADLLDRTTLSNVIRAGTVVADRLDTLQAFEHIIFDADWKARLLERTQLHRLLVHELWIMGEEYALGADDDGLRALLAKHLSIMNREELAPEADVKLIDQKDGIPDVMLYRRRKVDRDRFEHLVIELKRPSITLGQEETSQIKKYAFTVAKDERFDTRKCSWEFVLLGNAYDDFVKEELSSPRLPEACLHEGNGVRIWVRTWADVINDARSRLEFFRDQLAVEASHDRGIATLRAKYPHLFTARGASKKADLAATAGSHIR